MFCRALRRTDACVSLSVSKSMVPQLGRKKNYQKDLEINPNKRIISLVVSESVGGINLFRVR